MQTTFIETVIETVTEIEAEKRGELSPLRLAEKLKSIRASFKLTQGKMLIIINPKETDENNRARVSQYERGLHVPSLIEVYNYARFAGITVETLLNDDLDLPAALQCNLDEEETQVSDLASDEKVETNDEVETGETSPVSSESGEIKKSVGEEISVIGNEGINREELLDLPLLRGGNATEAATLSLSVETLDKLDDMRLELLRRMPRAARDLLTVESVVDFSVRVVQRDYETCPDKSLICRQAQLITGGLKPQPKNLKAEDDSFTA